MFFKGFEGFDKARKGLKPYKRDFDEGKMGKNMKKRDFHGKNGGIKMRLVLEEGRGGKWCLQQYFGFEISIISKCEMSSAVKF